MAVAMISGQETALLAAARAHTHTYTTHTLIHTHAHTHTDPSIVYFMVVAMISGQETALLAAVGAEEDMMTLVKSVGTFVDAAAVHRIIDRAVGLSVSTPRSFRRLVHRATMQERRIRWRVLQGGAGCCRVLQRVAGWCRVLQGVILCCSFR